MPKLKQALCTLLSSRCAEVLLSDREPLVFLSNPKLYMVLRRLVWLLGLCQADNCTSQAIEFHPLLEAVNDDLLSIFEATSSQTICSCRYSLGAIALLCPSQGSGTLLGRTRLPLRLLLLLLRLWIQQVIQNWPSNHSAKQQHLEYSAAHILHGISGISERPSHTREHPLEYVLRSQELLLPLDWWWQLGQRDHWPIFRSAVKL